MKKIHYSIATNCVFPPKIDNKWLKILLRYCIAQFYAFLVTYVGKSSEYGKITQNGGLRDVNT